MNRQGNMGQQKNKYIKSPGCDLPHSGKGIPPVPPGQLQCPHPWGLSQKAPGWEHHVNRRRRLRTSCIPHQKPRRQCKRRSPAMPLMDLINFFTHWGRMLQIFSEEVGAYQTLPVRGVPEQNAERVITGRPPHNPPIKRWSLHLRTRDEGGRRSTSNRI